MKKKVEKDEKAREMDKKYTLYRPSKLGLTGREFFIKEHKDEIKKRIAENRQSNDDTLPLYSEYSSSMWKALGPEGQDEYERKAEEHNRTFYNSAEAKTVTIQ